MNAQQLTMALIGTVGLLCTLMSLFVGMAWKIRGSLEGTRAEQAKANDEQAKAAAVLLSYKAEVAEHERQRQQMELVFNAQREQAASVREAAADAAAKLYNQQVLDAIRGFEETCSRFTTDVEHLKAQGDVAHKAYAVIQEHGERIAAIEARCEAFAQVHTSQRIVDDGADNDGVVLTPVGCPGYVNTKKERP